jgi:hypothetical protein
MAIPESYEFIVGLTVGKILLGALFASPLFRNIAVAGVGIKCWARILSKGEPVMRQPRGQSHRREVRICGPNFKCRRTIWVPDDRR